MISLNLVFCKVDFLENQKPNKNCRTYTVSNILENKRVKLKLKLNVSVVETIF